MVREITDKQEWDELVEAHGGHPLQLWGWGEVKAKHGWKAVRLEFSREKWAGCQLLIHQLPGPFRSLVYVPRGPVGQWTQAEYDELTAYVKARYKPTLITLEPPTVEYVPAKGWKKSSQRILLPRTVLLDLTKSEDELLADMTKKTRQYIRKSEKDGVTVRRVGAGDIDACLAIYRDTAKRAGFALHDEPYYRDVLSELGEHSPVYVAEYEGEIVAFLWLAASSDTAFELYGGVTDKGQEARANYTLKWQAILEQKAGGVKTYDLNGLLNDGISSFKLGFTDGHETMLAGTFDKPLSPLYGVWQQGLPLAKRVVRTLKR